LKEAEVRTLESVFTENYFSQLIEDARGTFQLVTNEQTLSICLETTYQE
jgi:hypothetical protein